MSLGDRIREKRKAKGMSGQQLGDVFGISRSSVSDWERGATRPDQTKLVRLAQALDTTVEYLLENSDGKPAVITQSPEPLKHTITDRNITGADLPAGKLPVITWAQAGEWGDKLNAKDLGDSVEWVTSPYPGEFVLRVVGDSMYNPGGDLSFRDGDLISVSATRDVVHKKLVVVQRRGESVPTFKQYLVENDGSVLLHALNPSWPNKYLPFDDQCRVVGVVTGQWREH
jgi:SOS-response transcriptional repressor LexA